MKKILLGTTNNAKIETIKSVSRGLGFQFFKTWKKLVKVKKKMLL